jgi:hypothetical protein
VDVRLPSVGVVPRDDNVTNEQQVNSFAGLVFGKDAAARLAAETEFKNDHQVGRATR